MRSIFQDKPIPAKPICLKFINRSAQLWTHKKNKITKK